MDERLDYCVFAMVRSSADRSNRDAGLFSQHYSLCAHHVGYQTYLFFALSVDLPSKRVDQNGRLHWRIYHHDFLSRRRDRATCSSHAKSWNTVDGKRPSEATGQICRFVCTSSCCWTWDRPLYFDFTYRKSIAVAYFDSPKDTSLPRLHHWNTVCNSFKLCFV